MSQSRSKSKDSQLWQGKYIRIPLAELIVPQEGFLNCFKNRWWAVTDDDCLLFYKSFGSPQCNINKGIVERIKPEGTTPRLIETVLVPVNPRDFV